MSRTWLDGVNIEWKVIGLVLFQMEKVYIVPSSMANEGEWIYWQSTHNKLCGKMGVISHLLLTCLANFIFETSHGLRDGCSNIPPLGKQVNFKGFEGKKNPYVPPHQHKCHAILMISTILFNMKIPQGELIGQTPCYQPEAHEQTKEKKV